MTTPLLLGILAAFVGVTVAAGLRRAPTWAQCPRCLNATEAVEPASWIRRMAPGFRVRWCPGCGWEGLGREGAEMTPGRPVAHGSGFRWGSERLPEDFGFRFAGLDDEVDPEPPTAAEPPVHPSGFRFGPGGEPAPDGEGEGFAWRERPREGAPVFFWKA